MRDVPVSLTLALQILDLFMDSGVTQVEQYVALDVARALVAVSGASLVIPSAERPESADEAVS